ncbi:MAG: divergent polysaccharide deacetylase family protein [Candidatus Aureabacteria bacterium]|nr:divergent polysaccharide deacetylase family protein [Candidatus Auribacterota bacterium]
MSDRRFSPPGILLAFLTLALLSGCARRDEIPPALSWEPQAARADAVVGEVFSGFLPAAEGFEIVEEQTGRSSLTLVLSPETILHYTLSQTVAGQLALVIDDVGRVPPDDSALAGLDYPLTIAILPRLLHTGEWDAFAHGLGYEVLLHCPLSTLDPELDLGPGGIADDLSSEEITDILRTDLESVPHAAGVNNHMGSAFTLETEPMRVFLGPTISRDIFLDHENTEKFILQQLKAVRSRALKNGRAVAIGHFRPLTLELLKREIPALARDGIQIVPLSDLVPKMQ